MKIPNPSISRICMIYNLLGELLESGQTHASSSEIGKILGIGAPSIRKDISYLGEIGNTGSRYDIKRLREHISNNLKLNQERKACIIGLGRLGSAVLNYDLFTQHGYKIVAGFDSNVNRLETLKTSIPLYPAYQIAEIIERENIELAILAVPKSAAKSSAERLIEGGIKGIVNFTPTIIKPPHDKIFISNVDVVKEFRELSALISLSDSNYNDETLQK